MLEFVFQGVQEVAKSNLDLSFSCVIFNSIFALKVFFEPKSLLATFSFKFEYCGMVKIGLILALPKLGYNLSQNLVIFGI